MAVLLGDLKKAVVQYQRNIVLVYMGTGGGGQGSTRPTSGQILPRGVVKKQ